MVPYSVESDERPVIPAEASYYCGHRAGSATVVDATGTYKRHGHGSGPELRGWMCPNVTGAGTG